MRRSLLVHILMPAFTALQAQTSNQGYWSPNDTVPSPMHRQVVNLSGLCKFGVCLGVAMAFAMGKLKVMAHRDRSLAWREERGEWEGGTNESDEAKTNFAKVGQAPKFLIHKLSFLHPWPLHSYRV